MRFCTRLFFDTTEPLSFLRKCGTLFVRGRSPGLFRGGFGPSHQAVARQWQSRQTTLLMKHTVAGTAPDFNRHSLLSLVSHPEMALGTLNAG